MKYSLRSLMIVFTALAVLVGGRIEYLRRWAVFHERLAFEHKRDGPLVLHVIHRDQAIRYRDGMVRPWQFINDPWRPDYDPAFPNSQAPALDPSNE